MPGLRASGSLAIAIVLFAGSADAQGQPPQQGPAQSSSQYTLNRGDPGGPEGADARARMRAGDCAGALNGFDAAIQKTIEPTLRRDRGSCHEKLGNRQAAIEDYRAYLTASPEAPDAPQIQQRLAALEGQKAPAKADEPPKETPEELKEKKPEKKRNEKRESSDLDEDPIPDGARIGLRAGYMVPLGETAEGNSLNEGISGGIPLWLDLGYRFGNGHVYVGGYFDFAFLFIKDSDGDCGKNGVSCSANQIRFGLMGAYHVMPHGPLDPWFGLGLGYEFLNLSISQDTSTGPRSASFSIRGFEFANIQLGADYLATPTFRVGPIVGLSLGQYTHASTDSKSEEIEKKSLHEWLFLGVRGAYDFF